MSVPKGTEKVQKGHGSDYDIRGTSEATDVNGVDLMTRSPNMIKCSAFLLPLVWLMSVRSSQLLREDPLESLRGYAGSAGEVFIQIKIHLKTTLC